MASSTLAATTPTLDQLRRLIADVPDFPSPGILFRDITPLLADPAGLALAVEYLAQPFRGRGIPTVVAVESRGFVLGAAVAQALSAGFVPVRKRGKLPGPVQRAEFALEYGRDVLEIKQDALSPGQRVLIVDDVLATGGTLAASAELVTSLGAVVDAIVVLLELTALNGRAKLSDYHTVSVLKY